jgi:hypothetical protein
VIPSQTLGPHQPAATALARLSAKRLQLASGDSVPSKRKLQLGGPQRIDEDEVIGVEAALSALRQVERGVLQTPNRLKFFLQYERTPVWLLALDANIVEHLWIVGHPNSESFFGALDASTVDVNLFRAAVHNISSQRVSYSLNVPLRPDPVRLVSGSFVSVRRWTTHISNPTLVLCEDHIRSLSLCSKQLRNSGDFSGASGGFRWLGLRHHTFGGVTKFQSILGTNIPDFAPVRTALRRTIRHVIDYGIKPSWANPSRDQKSMLSLDDRLHPDYLTKPVLYPTHYSATGWGSRSLS